VAHAEQVGTLPQALNKPKNHIKSSVFRDTTVLYFSKIPKCQALSFSKTRMSGFVAKNSHGFIRLSFEHLSYPGAYEDTAWVFLKTVGAQTLNEIRRRRRGFKTLCRLF
jgi:hypothetical protein